MSKPVAPKTGFSTNFLKGLPLPPLGKDRYHVAEGRDGFGIIVYSTGRKSFVKTYRFGDKTKLWTIGSFPAFSLHEAHDILAEGMKMLSRGLDPSVQSKAIKVAKVQSAQLTFGDFADKYLAKRITIGKSTVDTYRECLYNYVFQSKKPPRKDGKPYTGNVYFDWSNVPAEDITRDDIRSILDAMTANGITRRANLTLSVLKLLWKYGCRENLVKNNPADGIENPSKKSRGERYLDIDEISIFWNGLLKIRSQRTVLILRLILLLGRRETEVCGAMWKEFNLDRAEWFIPVRRLINGEMITSGLKVHESNEHLVSGLMVALPEQAVQMLRTWKGVTGNWDFVFPSEYNPTVPQDYKSLSRALSRNWHNMGLVTAVKPQDLRRTAKTHITRLGVPKYIRDRITAHSAGDSVEQTYNKYEFLTEKRQAMELWSAEVKRLIELAGSPNS